MHIINNGLQIYYRNVNGELEGARLHSVTELEELRFADLDPHSREEATQLLQGLESSPTYAGDLASARQEFLRQQADRRAKKKSLVIESTPRSTS